MGLREMCEKFEERVIVPVFKLDTTCCECVFWRGRCSKGKWNRTAKTVACEDFVASNLGKPNK